MKNSSVVRSAGGKRRSRRSFLQTVAMGTGMAASELRAATPSLSQRKSKAIAPEANSNGNDGASAPYFAKAVEFEEGVIFRPAKRPGYSAWVAPWRGADGSIFLSFIEKRRLPNPTFRP